MRTILSATGPGSLTPTSARWPTVYYKNNWLKTVSDPLAGVTSYQRDGVGQVTLATNANDTVAEMAYDKADRLLTLVNRQTVGARKTISSFGYTYDEVGQRVKIDAEYGWRNPPTVSTTYAYDPLRRLTRTENNEGAWTGYTFDAAGNRLTLSTNDDELSPKPFDAKAETYAYDEANELLSVITDTSANGVKPSRTANVAQALAAFRHEVAAQRGKHITTAAADALLAVADDLIARLYSNKPPSQSATATAIAALRTQVQAYRASGAIDSDGIANSLLVKLDKADKANQGKTGELQTTTYAYDNNGNRIGIAWPGPQGPQTQGTDYTYNYENLLTRALDYQAGTGGVRINRSLTTMGYDGLNRRLVKAYQPKIEESDVKRTEYTFDVLDPVAEYSMWNGQYNNYYRGDLGHMVAMQNFPSEQRYTYHYDGLGSISTLTKDGGVSVHTYRYDPYGYTYPDNGDWTAPHNGYTFTGQEYDEETSLLHFYARDYDPLRGVWMQQDPYRGQLPDPITLHRYMYARNQPTLYIDRDGRFPVLLAAVVVLAVIDVGWTAYDAWQATNVINDPNATEAAKDAASMDLAITMGAEVAEPDLGPVFLPLDDVVRKLPKWFGKQAAEEVAEKSTLEVMERAAQESATCTLKSLSRSNFRDNLLRMTGKTADEIAGMEAHHILPQAFEETFEKAGIETIHDPKFGTWVEKSVHQSFSWEYNEKWRRFLTQERSNDEILQYARQLSKEYGFDVNF